MLEDSKINKSDLSTQSASVVRLGKRDIIQYSDHLESRLQPLLRISEDSDENSALKLPKDEETLIESKAETKIIAFEVFKHYLALI